LKVLYGAIKCYLTLYNNHHYPIASLYFTSLKPLSIGRFLDYLFQIYYNNINKKTAFLK